MVVAVEDSENWGTSTLASNASVRLSGRVDSVAGVLSVGAAARVVSVDVTKEMAPTDVSKAAATPASGAPAPTPASPTVSALPPPPVPDEVGLTDATTAGGVGVGVAAGAGLGVGAGDSSIDGGAVTTARSNKACAAAPEVSVAMTRTTIVPIWASPGLPVKRRLAASKDSHGGSADPSASVAAYRSVSPASASVKVPAGGSSRKSAPSMASWPAIGRLSTGASLTLATLSTNSSNAPAPAASVAVTRISILPTSTLAGVPLNVRVLASNASQDGKAPPKDWRAA